MTCPNCGHQVPDNEVCCPNCGMFVSSPASSSQGMPSARPRPSAPPKSSTATKQKPQKGGAPVKVIGAVVLVVLLVAAAAVFFLPGLLPTAEEPPKASEIILPTEEPTEEPTEPVEEGPISSEAEHELLDYVDEAEEVVTTAYNDLVALENDDSLDYLDMLGQQVDILSASLSELLDIQTKANGLSGIDSNLKNAAKVYFDMICDSQNAYYEVLTFQRDYMEFYAEFLWGRPDIADYNSMSGYYNDLADWYEESKEAYGTITCPSCLDTKWAKYGEVLDLNWDIASKLYYADAYGGDVLRIYSATYMSIRYETMEENLYNELQDCLTGEQSHFLRQKNTAAQLADEMHAYVDLDETERDGYEFESVTVGEIELAYDAIDTIYPALYNSYDAFLIIKTGCLNGTRKIVVEAEIPGFTQTYKESFTLDPAYTEIYIKPPAVTGDLNLTSAKDAQITLTISEQDGSLIEAKTFPVTLKSKYDVDWYSDEYGVSTRDNILCFLTPESSSIAELKRLAIDEMTAITGGKVEAFAGYQNVTSWKNYVYTYLEAAGLMRAMYESGVRYNMDVFSISGSNQHILFPEDVLVQQSGLCIETSLVVASALQSAGMHAFLVCPPGHAQVAVETWSGSGTYFLIETTSLSSSNNSREIFAALGNMLIEEGQIDPSNSFPITYPTNKQWAEYLSVSGTYVIDCDDSRTLGLTPFFN